MTETHFKIAFAILWVAYIAIRVPHDKRYKEVEKKRVLKGRIEPFALFAMMIGMGLLPILWVIFPWFSGLDITLPYSLRVGGIALAVCSLVYFWWVHKSLGVNWSPTLEIRQEHQLVKTGPYKYIRHPMYLQIWLWAFAQALIISNWVIGFAGIVAWALLYFSRVPMEEKMMAEEFGDEYRNYMKDTGRVLPRL